MRKFFIHSVARDLNLVFPSSTATAMTIRSMHSAADGGDSAGCELKVTMYAFVGAMILRIVSQYALGLLWVCSMTQRYSFCVTFIVNPYFRHSISGSGILTEITIKL